MGKSPDVGEAGDVIRGSVFSEILVVRSELEARVDLRLRKSRRKRTDSIKRALGGPLPCPLGEFADGAEGRTTWWTVIPREGWEVAASTLAEVQPWHSDVCSDKR